MIAWNWKPTLPVFMDVETVSVADLRAEGSRRYLAHNSTRLLSAAFLFDGLVTVWVPIPPPCLKYIVPETLAAVPVEIVTGPDVPPRVADAIRRGATFVAHNAEAFDAQAWRRFAPPDLQPTWLDTMHAARVAGLPGGLDAACEMVGLEGKTDGGRANLMLLSKAKLAGKKVEYPVGTLPVWFEVLKYNVQDVVIMERLYAHLQGFAVEGDILDAYAQINERGIKVDLMFAAIVRKLWELAQAEAADDLDDLTDGDMEDVPRSAPRFKAWLEKQGYSVSSLNRAHIAALIRGDYFGDAETNPVAAKIEAAIAARQLVSRATVGKVDRVFKACDADKRCRDLFVYHGAHTGRATSRRLQAHNMPRGIALDLDKLLGLYHTQGYFTLDDVRDAAGPGANIGDAIATLTRPIIVADDDCEFVIADYASVEARGVAWLAGDLAALASFAGDPYCYMASRLFGREITKADEKERQVGKTVVLGCGYSMGPLRFEESCKLLGVDLKSVGLTGEVCVRTYRDAFAKIQELWWNLHRAATAVIAEDHSIAVTNRCMFERRGSSMLLTLPSGRKLVYRHVGYTPTTKGKELHYRSTHGYTARLYGGKLCLAGDTRVITDNGVKRIVDVTTLDRVWDGYSWQQHDGLIYQGDKEVIKWLGVSLTGDHLIRAGASWKPATLLDEKSSRLALLLGRALAPLKCSYLASGKTAGRRADAIAGESAQSLIGASCEVASICANRVARQERASGEAKHLVTGKSYQISNCCPCGCTAGQAQSLDATTPTIEPTRTTGVAVSPSARSGATTLARSFDTQSLYLDGPTPTSTWIEPITTEITSRETFGLSHDPSTHATDVTPVYDLVNCGPLSRFMILTDAGPVIVHNCENIVQAMCRDIHHQHMVETNRVYPVVLHVHDEIVFELRRDAIREAFERIGVAMSTPPDWAQGFPLAVELFTCAHYAKSKPKGCLKGEFTLGKRVK